MKIKKIETELDITNSKKISETLLEDFFDIILESIIENKKVKIAKFGTFILRKKSLILTYFLILAMVVLVKMELYNHF